MDNRINFRILAILLILSMLFSGCQHDIEHESKEISVSTSSNNKFENTVFDAFQPPDKLSPNDIAVRVIEKTGFDASEKNLRYLQIYYGYYIGDTVTYIPCEELDLFSIIDKNGDSGYYAAGNSHVVVIGDCLLIALAVHDASDYDDIIVKDSLNSSVMEISEYFTHYDLQKETDGIRYGYCKQNSSAHVTEDDVWFAVYDGFPEWYYVIRKIDDIKENYELTLTKQKSSSGSNQESDIFKLTYQDIKNIYSHTDLFG